MPDLPLRKVLNKIRDGEIQIPAFQRGFIWTPDKVSYLMDSIYKGYPIGSVLIWRAKEKLASERDLGPYQIPQPIEGYPIDYVLDGQQRLTSIFGVFETILKPREESSIDWLDIYFDIEKNEDAQDSQFVALSQDKVIESKHFPLKSVFDPVVFRQATDRFAGDQGKLEKLLQLATIFTEFQLPTQIVETQDREKIAIIFERINRTGVALSNFELLSAWTWSEEFDLKKQINDLSEELEEFGFGDIDREENVILKLCAAVVEGDTSTKTVMSLKGSKVRDQFDNIEIGLKGAIDFLRLNCHVESYSVLPYATMLVPLAMFFTTTSKTGKAPTDSQRKSLVRWFWKSCFARRYSNSVDNALINDLELMRQIKQNPDIVIDDLILEIDNKFFINNSFSIKSVNTKTFVLMLASQSPRSLLNGQPVKLDSVLQNANRNEFHHIYPKNFLKRSGITNRNSQWMLANFCFLSMVDNRVISNKSPSDYKLQVPNQDYTEILKSNVIPVDEFGQTYDEFIEKRASDLLNLAKQLSSQ